jgi:hypothetical protein
MVKVGRDGIVDANLALLDELHDAAGGGDDFRKRSNVENGVERHRFFGGLKLAVAEGLLIDDLSVMTDQHDCAGNSVFADGLRNSGFDISGAAECSDGSVDLACAGLACQCDKNDGLN